MSLVSVIIPAYNAQKTIETTIKSVLNQTWTDLELIIINDGSTDQTLEVINRFDDPRLKVFSYPNGGVSASRNRGFARSSGAYVSFIDADDLWTPDKLEWQLKALKNEPEAAVAYSWTDYIDKAGNLVEQGERVTLSGNVYPELLVSYFLSSGSNALIKQEALVKVGGFDETLTGPEDWDLFIRLATCYPFVAVPRLGILYRICHNQSISTNLHRQEDQSLRVIEKSFQQAPESLQNLKKKSLANLYRYISFKAIENSYTKEQGILAARYYCRALNSDILIFKQQIGANLRVGLKILATIILPPQLTGRFVSAWRLSSQQFRSNGK